jgi:hypothetical protein
MKRTQGEMRAKIKMTRISNLEKESAAVMREYHGMTKLQGMYGYSRS